MNFCHLPADPRTQKRQRWWHGIQDFLDFTVGTDAAPHRIMGVHSFYELRAWQSARTFKLAIYRLIDRSTLAKDFKLRDQLRESARSAASHVAEGYGRFNPADFARFLGMAKASLIEAQNHLQDAVDAGHITEESRIEHEKTAQAALGDVTSLLEYLQSPQAAENAKRVRARRQAQRRRTPKNRPPKN